MDEADILQAEQELDQQELVIQTQDQQINQEWRVEAEREDMEVVADVQTKINQDVVEQQVCQEQIVANQLEILNNNYAQDQLVEIDNQNYQVLNNNQATAVRQEERSELYQNQEIIRSEQAPSITLELTTPQSFLPQQEQIVVSELTVIDQFASAPREIVEQLLLTNEATFDNIQQEVVIDPLIPTEEAVTYNVQPIVEVESIVPIQEQVIVGLQVQVEQTVIVDAMIANVENIVADSVIPVVQQAVDEQAVVEQAMVEQTVVEQAVVEQAVVEQAVVEQAVVESQVPGYDKQEIIEISNLPTQQVLIVDQFVPVEEVEVQQFQPVVIAQQLAPRVVIDQLPTIEQQVILVDQFVPTVQQTVIQQSYIPAIQQTAIITTQQLSTQPTYIEYNNAPAIEDTYVEQVRDDIYGAEQIVIDQFAPIPEVVVDRLVVDQYVPLQQIEVGSQLAYVDVIQVQQQIVQPQQLMVQPQQLMVQPQQLIVQSQQLIVQSQQLMVQPQQQIVQIVQPQQLQRFDTMLPFDQIQEYRNNQIQANCQIIVQTLLQQRKQQKLFTQTIIQDANTINAAEIRNQQIRTNLQKQRQILTLKEQQVKLQLRQIRNDQQMMNAFGVNTLDAAILERQLLQTEINIQNRNIQINRQQNMLANQCMIAEEERQVATELNNNYQSSERIMLERERQRQAQDLRRQYANKQIRRKEQQLALERAEIQSKQAEILQQMQVLDNQNITFQQRLKEEEVIFQQNTPNHNQTTNQLSTVMESQVYYNSFFEWKTGIAVIQNETFKIPQKSLPLIQLTKIKILKETGIHNSKRIKLSYYTNNLLFSVGPSQTIFNLPLHYFWFAKIITQKMRLRGCDLKSPYIPQRTFTNINIKNAYIDGIIYKQSQYRKSWELRYIAITPDGLFSYKDEKGGETFSIKKDTANQIWTRFDIHERMLIIKVHHGSRKTQFGIPITDYCIDSATNWLLPFYKIIFPQ